MALAVVTATQNPAEASRQVQVVNQTGETINYVYINGRDILGNSSLPNRSSCSFTINSGNIFDIKIVFASGRDVYWDNEDLHTVWRITFIRNGSYIRLVPN